MHSNSQNSRRPSKYQPNYFVALQVPDSEIHKAVLDVQKALCDANICIAPELVDIAKLHITLLVARIENDEQLLDACSALDNCGAILAKKFTGSPPVHVSFQGLSNFYNKIIFAKLVEDNNFCTLKEIGNIVREEFSKMNVAITDKRPLNPHLTIAKLLAPPNWRNKTSLLEINQKFLNYNFGSQILSGLKLLKMSDENGCYALAKEVSFTVSENT